MCKCYVFYSIYYFSELSEVKEHDKEVTTQANTAQDEVRLLII